MLYLHFAIYKYKTHKYIIGSIRLLGYVLKRQIFEDLFDGSQKFFISFIIACPIFIYFSALCFIILSFWNICLLSSSIEGKKLIVASQAMQL